jgi:predicted permease
MKLSLKHSSIAMAACASLYALSILIRQIPAVQGWTFWQSHIGYLPQVAVLIGMIILGIGLYQNQEQTPRLTLSLQHDRI